MDIRWGMHILYLDYNFFRVVDHSLWLFIIIWIRLCCFCVWSYVYFNLPTKTAFWLILYCCLLDLVKTDVLICDYWLVYNLFRGNVALLDLTCLAGEKKRRFGFIFSLSFWLMGIMLNYGKDKGWWVIERNVTKATKKKVNYSLEAEVSCCEQ